jgi:hypothetical protein
MDMISQETLQELWRFTEDDLQQNRQGRLSGRQIEAQTASLATTVKVGLIGVAVVISLVVITAVILGGLCMVPVVLACGALFAGWILRHKRRAMADLQTGQVEVMRGAFQLDRRVTRTSSASRTSGATRRVSYYLLVGEQRFLIRSEVYHKLSDSEGGEIVVYYLDRSRRIVAAEMV